MRKLFNIERYRSLCPVVPGESSTGDGLGSLTMTSRSVDLSTLNAAGQPTHSLPPHQPSHHEYVTHLDDDDDYDANVYGAVIMAAHTIRRVHL